MPPKRFGTSRPGHRAVARRKRSPPPGRGRSAGARAVRRRQPRHRGAGACRAACRRASSSACAHRSWAEIFRFRSSTATPRSAGSRAARRPWSGGRCSRCIRTRASSPFAADAAALVPAGVPPAPRGAGRQYGNRAQRGVGRVHRAPATASPSSAAAWSDCCWSRLCARLPGAEVTRRRYPTRRAPNRACARRPLRACRYGARRL